MDLDEKFLARLVRIGAEAEISRLEAEIQSIKDQIKAIDEEAQRSREQTLARVEALVSVQAPVMAETKPHHTKTPEFREAQRIRSKKMWEQRKAAEAGIRRRSRKNKK